jgi:hypothetical protein
MVFVLKTAASAVPAVPARDFPVRIMKYNGAPYATLLEPPRLSNRFFSAFRNAIL